MSEKFSVVFSFNKKKSLFGLLTLAFLVSVFLIYRYGPIPVTSVKYREVPLFFRADLKQAQEIPVFPNEEAVKSDFQNNIVTKISIVYISNGNEDSILAVESFEIANKLSIFYRLRSNQPTIVLFEPYNVSSFNGLEGTPENPIILIKTPSQSSVNQVTTQNHVTTVEGRTLKELDLAVIKFIMLVMDLNV